MQSLHSDPAVFRKTLLNYVAEDNEFFGEVARAMIAARARPFAKYRTLRTHHTDLLKRISGDKKLSEALSFVFDNTADRDDTGFCKLDWLNVFSRAGSETVEAAADRDATIETIIAIHGKSGATVFEPLDKSAFHDLGLTSPEHDFLLGEAVAREADLLSIFRGIAIYGREVEKSGSLIKYYIWQAAFMRFYFKEGMDDKGVGVMEYAKSYYPDRVPYFGLYARSK